MEKSPSDEGGGFCIAKDGGRETNKKSKNFFLLFFVLTVGFL